jgi:hypothetical protein
MKRQRTLKRKLKLKRGKSVRRGGGWGDLPKGSFNQVAVSPGYPVHFAYTGPGKDCTGNPMSERPGYIASYSAKGLPGLSGGGKRRKRRGGAAMPSAASHSFGGEVGPITNPNLPPVSGSITPKPGDFPDTTGAGGTVAHPAKGVTMSMPGVPTPPGAAQMPVVSMRQGGGRRKHRATKKRGGRYGFFPGMGPLGGENGIGTSPAPFGRIACETGTYNPLNPNPGDIQRLSTAPLTPPIVSGRMMGGASNFPQVTVGAADSMRYYAPTAGYRNDFIQFPAGGAVPGLTIQTPYDARAFNQACIKTGGGGPVAYDAGAFSPVTMKEVGSRMDFDGTKGGLPVKFGGRRTKRRVFKRKSRKN